MKKFEVVAGPPVTTGGKQDGRERTETTVKRYRIRNNRTLAILPKLYESMEHAQAECDRLEAD